jgi:hypothetical protein
MPARGAPAGHSMSPRQRAFTLSDRRLVALSIVLAVTALVGMPVASASGVVGRLTPSPGVGPAAISLAITSPTWTKLSGLSPHPSARFGAVMAYDPANQMIVLFGGLGARGVLLNDTWTYSAGTWTRLSTPAAPAPRVAATMVWDGADHYLLLFGGETNQSSPQGCSGSANVAVYCADTWTFAHGKWTLLHPPSSPPGRWFAAMAYDPALDESVLGGGAGAGNLSDMWTFHAGAWTQVTLPPPHSAHNPFDGRYSSMSYDGHDSYLVYFGPGRFPANQTWNYTGANWTQLSTTHAPPGVASASLAFDPGLGWLLLFGGTPSGFPGSGALGNTWGFHAGVWTNLTHGAHPPARSATTMAYDSADGYMLLFGGASAAGALLGDTWTLQ